MSLLDDLAELRWKKGVHDNQMLGAGTKLEPRFQAMLEHIDPDGTIVQRYVVRVMPGGAIVRHKHEEWTVVYYVQDAEVQIGEKIHDMYAGETIVLGPRIWHSVPKNRTEEPRLSLVILVRRST